MATGLVTTVRQLTEENRKADRKITVQEILDELARGYRERDIEDGQSIVEIPLDEAMTIRRLAPPLFIATKLEAYLGRGGGDLIGSRDAEDILLLVDGREELVDEIAAADADEQFRALLADRDFDHFLEGNIRGPEGRADIVRDRFIALSQLGNG